MVLLTSGTISSPVPYLDMTLPGSYQSFQLMVCALTMSDRSVLALDFSPDGGTTFYCDPANFDSYSWKEIENFFNGDTQVFRARAAGDSLLDIDNAPNTGAGLITGQVIIFPGDTDNYAAINGQVSARDPLDDAYTTNVFTYGGINPAATVPITKARVNLVRILPYGNGDEPPTSGINLTGGAYFLWGMLPA